MNERSQRVRDALDAYRRTPALAAAHRDRLWARIHGSIDHGAEGPPPDDRDLTLRESAPSAPLARIDKTRTAMRIGIALAVAAAALLLIRTIGGRTLSPAQSPTSSDQALYGQRPAPEQNATAAGSRRPEPPVAARPAPQAAPTRASIVPPPAPNRDSVLTPHDRAEPRRSPVHTRRSAPTQALPPSRDPATAPADSLRDEIDLMNRARRALAGKRLEIAAAALDAHARRHPQGQMVEDRMALRVQVLCANGRGPAAATAARAFSTAYPDSTHAETVRATLARARAQKCSAR